jgi:hypothetical protein
MTKNIREDSVVYDPVPGQKVFCGYVEASFLQAAAPAAAPPFPFDSTSGSTGTPTAKDANTPAKRTNEDNIFEDCNVELKRCDGDCTASCNSQDIPHYLYQ